MASTQAVIDQLNTARRLALGSSSDYVQLVTSVLPVLLPTADVALRRWGADLLAEAFAAPMVSVAEKEKLGPAAVPVLARLLPDTPAGPDIAISKNCILAAASVYPILFRQCALNPTTHAAAWPVMVDLKTKIARLTETGPAGVRMCGIKFCQRVVVVQTAAAVDPRTQHVSADVSVSIVPRSHPFLNPAGLEAEASGLLSRMLTMLVDITTDLLLLSAILNSLSGIVRARPKLVTVVIESALTFRPFAGIQRNLSASSHVAIRSIERTTRIMFKAIMSRFPGHPLTNRVKDYLARLDRSHVDLLEQASRKRPAPSDSATDEPADPKRPRLQPTVAAFPPLPAGPVSLAQLFTLTTNSQLAAFDVKALPADVVVRLLVPLLQAIDGSSIDRAVGEVVRRCHLLNERAPSPAQASLLAPAQPDPARMASQAGQADRLDGHVNGNAPAPNPSNLANPGPNGDTHDGDGAGGNDNDDDDDDFYRPPKRADEPPTGPRAGLMPASVPAKPQLLPQPGFLPADVAAAIGSLAVDKLLARMEAVPSAGPGGLADDGAASQTAPSFAAPPPAASDREGWFRFLARAANRADAGLDPDEFIDEAAAELMSAERIVAADLRPGVGLIGTKIRTGLLQFVLQNFRQNIGLAISWLSEEWAHDKRRLDDHSRSVGDVDGPDSDVEPSGSAESGRAVGRNKKRKLRRQRKQRLLQQQRRQNEMHPLPVQQYKIWTIRLVDGIVPFLESRDKVLIRLLSELPLLDHDILSRVQKLAEDPERVGLCTQALQYLIMLRIPVREMCLDIVENLFRNYEDARPYAKKILVRWRPGSVKERAPPGAGGRGRHAPVLVDRSEATMPGDGLPWD